MNDDEKNIIELKNKIDTLEKDVKDLKDKVNKHDSLLIDNDKYKIETKFTLENISKSVKKIEETVEKIDKKYDELDKKITEDKIKDLEESDKELKEWKKTFVKKAIAVILGLIASGGTIGTIVYNCFK